MRKKILFINLLFLSLVIIPSDSSIPVKKCIEVLGGEGAVRKFSNFEALGKVKFERYGFSITGKLHFVKKGRKSWKRTDLKFGSREMTVIGAFDGKSAWVSNSGIVRDEPSLNYISELKHTFELLLKKDAKISLSGTTEINGKKAQGVELTLNGSKTVFFLDEKDFTILEIKYKDSFFGRNNTKESIKKKIRFSDYRKTGDVLFPYKIEFFEKGKKSYEYRFESVKFNPDIKNSKFNRPDQKLDLRYYEEKMS